MRRHNVKSSQDLQTMLRRKSSAASNKHLQASADHQYAKRVPFHQQNEMYQMNSKYGSKKLIPESSSGLDLGVAAGAAAV